MKVLLLNPTDFNRPKRLSAFTLPLGLLYVASYLQSKEKSCEVKIIDCLAESKSMGQQLDQIKRFNPDLIGISVITYFVKDSIDLSKEIKKILPNSKIVFGGLHAIAMPEELLKEKAIDFVLTGEAEHSFHQLYLYLKREISIKDVSGLYYKTKTGIKHSATQPMISNLDELPFPNRDLVNLNLYMQIEKSTSILASRGCHYSCIFCSHTLAFGNKIRRRSPNNIIAEIKEIKKRYNINSFFFIDSLFLSSLDHTSELCDLIIEEKLSISWSCMTRVDTLISTRRHSEDEIFSVLKKMKNAGCDIINIGIESGNQKILDLNKKAMKLNDVEKVIALIKKAKIEPCGMFVLGLAGETKKTMNDTLRFAKKLNIGYVMRSTEPLPGTEFYEFAKNNKMLPQENYWMSDDYEIRAGMLKYKNFSTRDINLLVEKGFVKKVNIKTIQRKLKLLINSPNPQSVRHIIFEIKELFQTLAILLHKYVLKISGRSK